MQKNVAVSEALRYRSECWVAEGTQPSVLPQPRLIAVGESMAMIVPALAESLTVAEELRIHAAGAESNVACHSAALGVASAWVSALGDDVLGYRVRSEIAGRGVDVRWVRTDPDAPTGVYFKDPGKGVLYYRRGSAASRLTPAAVADVPLEGAEVVHVSGITPALSDGCAALVDAVIERIGNSTTMLTFDVNYRAVLWAPDVAASRLRAIARRADVVFVGLDEAQTVWGTDTGDNIRALLPEPEYLVVKDGGVGATEFARTDGVETVSFVAAIATPVVEPVGAGDAFAAGYLVALMNGASARERLSAGHARASLVLQSMSDFVPESS